MTYFFFGTLMDRDVLATVLDRAVAHEEMIPAWLHDYARVRAATVSYPILVTSPGVVVRPLGEAVGSSPRVTAWWIIACFCSSSSAISFCLARM